MILVKTTNYADNIVIEEWTGDKMHQELELLFDEDPTLSQYKTIELLCFDGKWHKI